MKTEKTGFSQKYRAIVMGVSAGGMNALEAVLFPLPPDFPVPLIIVQHMSPDQSDNYLIEYLNNNCSLNVKEADEKELIQGSNVYMAPPDYHLLLESDGTLSMSVDDRVNYSRPSIDVLFESAAEAYSSGLIGIVLTGANSDGAEGLKTIKENGGLTIVQDPETAESRAMPVAAIEKCDVDYILGLDKISDFLLEITGWTKGVEKST